jgi:hypothetical protein
MDDDLRERIVKLETEMLGVRQQNAELLSLVRNLSDQLTKYKGFVGGIVFVGSALATLVTLFAKKLGIA